MPQPRPISNARTRFSACRARIESRRQRHHVQIDKTRSPSTIYVITLSALISHTCHIVRRPCRHRRSGSFHGDPASIPRPTTLPLCLTTRCIHALPMHSHFDPGALDERPRAAGDGGRRRSADAIPTDRFWGLRMPFRSGPGRGASGGCPQVRGRPGWRFSERSRSGRPSLTGSGRLRPRTQATSLRGSGAFGARSLSQRGQVTSPGAAGRSSDDVIRNAEKKSDDVTGGGGLDEHYDDVTLLQGHSDSIAVAARKGVRQLVGKLSKNATRRCGRRGRPNEPPEGEGAGRSPPGSEGAPAARWPPTGPAFGGDQR